MRPAQIVGRGGLSLDDAWAKRPSAYLAISIPDFPNLFMLNGPNGPVGNFSLIEVAELQFGYILQLVEQLRSGACREISPKRDVTESYEAERSEAAKNSIWTTGCRSWYLDAGFRQLAVAVDPSSGDGAAQARELRARELISRATDVPGSARLRQA
jgi:hypothetical protein